MFSLSPTNITCSFTACTSVGCDSGVPVCAEENGVCKIQCGPTHYRFGEYCYYCSEIDSSTPCQECDGKGKCTTCAAGYGFVNGECVACTGNTYSPGVTSSCQEGKQNCFLSDHTSLSCERCNEYFTLDTESGTCIECVEGLWLGEI